MVQSKPQLVYTLAGFSCSAGIFSVVISCLVLSGWAFDIASFKSVLPGLATMKVNIAICFLLAGSSLLLWQRADTVVSSNLVTIRRIAIALAGAVTVIAAITLSQYLFNWDAGIDELIVRVPKTDAALPGRMSSATAFEFVLIGITLLLLSGKERSITTTQSLAAVAVVFSLFSLLAYLFNLGHFAELYQVKPFSSVAVHTAFTFFVLSAGLLTLRAEHGWVSAFAQDTPSAMMGRHFLIATLLVLPIISELCIIGQNLGLYGMYFGITIITVSSMTILSLFNWFNTRAGNSADEKISNLNRTYAVLSGVNTLIVRVHSREELFEEACRIAAEIGKFPWAWIATMDPYEKRWKLIAWQGVNEGLLASLPSRLSPHGAELPQAQSLIEQVVSRKAPVILNDIADISNLSIKDVERNNELRANGIRSLVLLPLIVSGDVVGVFALHADATDFFDETEMRLLIELAGDISFAVNNIEKEAKLNYLAYYDALTDLPNNTLFLERLQQAIVEVERIDAKLAMIMFDVVHFKSINDALGRALGDELLRQVAERMQKQLEETNHIARISADRFAIFILGFRTADEVARKIEQKIHEVFDLPFMLRDTELKVSAKCGAALFPDDGTDMHTLFRNVEAALKKAKASGEKYLFYTQEMTERVAERLAFENRLTKAIEKNELVLYYQPKVDSESRKIYGVEALMRWQSPELGLVSPAEFIPLMEETGMILEAGAWALRQATLDYRRWAEQGVTPPRIAVNVSPIQLRHRKFGEVLESVIADSPASHGIDLEITESVIMDDVTENIEKLKMARGMGAEISVDDFGTGYSSLRYLAQLPVHILKIDRSFVTKMLDDPNTLVLVSAIISLAHSLNLKVVAEGVDSEEQAKVLRNLKCNQIQGYLISKPVPWERMLVLIAQDETRVRPHR